MAAPKTTGKFLIMLGDGATPTEAFAFPCGANARSVKLKNNLGEETVLDCADPLGSGSWVERWLESQDTELTISGRLASDSLPMWRAWADDGVAKNIRIDFALPAADGGGYYELAAYLEELEITGEGNGNSKATISATIKGSGPREWTAAV